MPVYSPSPSMLKWSPYLSFIQPFAPFCKNHCVHSLLHAIIGRPLSSFSLNFSTGTTSKEEHDQNDADLGLMVAQPKKTRRQDDEEEEEVLLLKWGLGYCDVDSVDADGLTPLNYAAKLGILNFYLIILILIIN